MKIDAEKLDSTQYTVASIEKYESVFGKDFISPGGKNTALELTQRLGIRPAQRVLDVGCGLGGSAFLLATCYDAMVDGIDLSHNMIDIAKQRLDAHGLSDKVMLFQGDCLALEADCVYDAIYSRDVFLHIHDKPALFTNLRTLLRDGGQLLFTDYCCGPKPWGDDFAAYVEQRQYDLHTLDEYAVLVRQAGFRDVRSEDRTGQFIQIAKQDIATISRLALDEQTRAALTADWCGKIERAERGEQRWGLIEAVK